MKNENEQLILDKQKEIENYKRILNNYVGRWWNQGKTHLEQLEAELEVLKNNGT